ncbi:relaxase/mobilization nuclease domain-containing protein [Streptacidiphilus fuscans]|uniref:Mobilization protein n=1 Tax=Streptacidiphilus fuscans TaxID=2789292 RepID=A0A931B5X5_9ACTN|nr:mobilization protein [Streptacidiphilus fuscans]MBF9071815.1 mobilization protein [Streptacidiphilus fuscans]
MVPNIIRRKKDQKRWGRNTYGLLRYLFGPGEANEHTDQHLVTSWNPMLTAEPGQFVFGSGEHTARMRDLARHLDLPVNALEEQQRPKRWVWHCSVRNDPGDRILSDEEWATAARRILHATGLAPQGDDRAVRWAVVRHAEDHIHIVATLVRQDGRRPRHHNDAGRAQTECRTIEREWGLRQLNPGDGTAAKAPSRGEIAKAARQGRPEASRDALRRAARAALIGSGSEEEFFARLEDQGVLVNLRRLPSGDIGGYSVAVLGDTNAQGVPVWFAGRKLAADLSLPKIRARFDETEHTEPVLRDQAQPEPATGTAGAEAAGERPIAARRAAAATVEHATTVVVSAEPELAAGEISDLTEVLDALAQTTPTVQRSELVAAARAYDRAARSHVRAARTQDRALRRAADELMRSGYLLRSSKDGGASAWLLSALVLAVFAVANWHSQRGHHQQAAAARESAQHLRRAYQQTAGQQLAALHREGRRLPGPARQRHRTTALRYHPHQAQQVDEGMFDALAYTLHQAEQHGHDPAELLRRATASRELDSAQDVTAVLVWRIRNLVDLPAPTPEARRPERPEHGGDRAQAQDGPGRQR